jgi:hypothetical protein
MSSSQLSPTSQGSPTSGTRGVGGALFAGTLMIIGGFFWFLEGLAGVVHNAFYKPVQDYYNISATTWGWVHMLLGILVLAAGFAVFAGQTWARVTGIILASVSAIVNFFFIPWYPVWAITIIAIDIWVIHALSVYQPDEI